MKKIYYALYYAPLVLFLAVFWNPFGIVGITVIVPCAIAVITALILKILTSPGRRQVPWPVVVMLIVAFIGIILLILVARIK